MSTPRSSLFRTLYCWGLAVLFALGAGLPAFADQPAVVKAEPSLEQRMARMEAYLANGDPTAAHSAVPAG